MHAVCRIPECMQRYDPAHNNKEYCSPAHSAEGARRGMLNCFTYLLWFVCFVHAFPSVSPPLSVSVYSCSYLCICR